MEHKKTAGHLAALSAVLAILLFYPPAGHFFMEFCL